MSYLCTKTSLKTIAPLITSTTTANNLRANTKKKIISYVSAGKQWRKHIATIYRNTLNCKIRKLANRYPKGFMTRIQVITELRKHMDKELLLRVINYPTLNLMQMLAFYEQ